MPADDTQKSILDAAEELLAELGFAAMSMRGLTTKAHVNLAAVHYHFGSKEDLVKAVMRRRVAPVNTERLQRLDAIELAERESGTSPDARAIIHAFLEPALAIAKQEGGTRACAMFGRLLAEVPPFLREWMVEQFGEIVDRFGRALHRAAPHVPEAEALWRLHFLVGSMTHTMLHGPMLAAVTNGRCDPSDHELLLERMVTFATAGVMTEATNHTRDTREKRT